MKKIFSLILVIMMMTFSLSAQNASNLSARFSGDQKLTFPVKVWGEVVNPGIYDVPIGYDFMAVLSIAGGPTSAAKLTNVKILRAHKVEGEEKMLIYVDLLRYIETGDETLVPEVRQGDTIMIPPKFGKDLIANFATFLALAQSLSLVVYYVVRIQDSSI